METVLLVDLSGYMHRAFHVAAGQPADTAANGTLSSVRWLASKYAHVAICCDAERSFRYKLTEQVDWEPEYKGYKDKRPPSDPVLQAQLARVERELYSEGFHVFKAQGFEADDLMATLCAWCRANGYAVDIATEDKDLRSLITDEEPPVRVIRKDGTVCGVEEVRKRFSVEPNRLIELLAIAGDTGDGVPGVTGLGPVEAAKLLNSPKLGTFPVAHALAADEVADVLAEEALRAQQKASGEKMAKLLPRKFTPGNRAAIANGLRAYEVSLQLVTLRADAPIDCARVLAPKAVPEDAAFEAEQQDLLLRAQAQAEEDERAAIEAVALATETENQEQEIMSQPQTVPDAEFTETAAPAERPSQPEEAAPQSPAPSVVAAPAQPVAAPAATAQPAPANGAAKPAAAPQTTALAKSTPVGPPVAFDRQLEARNLQEVDWLARALATSKKIKDCQDASSVITKIVLGRSLGMNLYQSLRLYIVEGQVAMRAAQVLARVKVYPQCEYIRKTHGDDKSCTWVTKRKGEPEQSHTFTVERAKRAMLGGSDGKSGFKPESAWAKWTEDMLSARTMMPLMRENYPEIADGYAAEEFDVETREQRDEGGM